MLSLEKLFLIEKLLRNLLDSRNKVILKNKVLPLVIK